MKNTLLDNFYTEISSTFSTENQFDFSCVINLNAEHPIYKGHFEQVPVTPGVCLTQIIKELLMNKFQKELRMTQGDNIKYLAIINPKECPQITVSFQVKDNEDPLSVNATFSHGSVTYVKFKGKFSQDS
ncbi:MAG: 3-hydroxyacyl-ACP dehydratase [Bacteroidia bacterium]